jgi:hypothetical protein
MWPQVIISQGCIRLLAACEREQRLLQQQQLVHTMDP